MAAMASASVVCVACAKLLPNSCDRRSLQSAPDRRTLSEVTRKCIQVLLLFFFCQESQASSAMVACFLEAIEIASDIVLTS